MSWSQNLQVAVGETIGLPPVPNVPEDPQQSPIQKTNATAHTTVTSTSLRLDVTGHMQQLDRVLQAATEVHLEELVVTVVGDVDSDQLATKLVPWMTSLQHLSISLLRGGIRDDLVRPVCDFPALQHLRIFAVSDIDVSLETLHSLPALKTLLLMSGVMPKIRYNSVHLAVIANRCPDLVTLGLDMDVSAEASPVQLPNVKVLYFGNSVTEQPSIPGFVGNIYRMFPGLLTLLPFEHWPTRFDQMGQRLSALNEVWVGAARAIMEETGDDDMP